MPKNNTSAPKYTHPAFLTPEIAAGEAEKFIASIPPYPNTFSGRGIVICGGGVKYFTCAWVCINMLRRLGCALPVELWHFGDKEMSEKMRALVAPLGVECVDALKVREKHPVRTLNGWELKPYAIIHSRFREVLFLDADNMPVVNPEYLFDDEHYQQTGAVLWPDRPHFRLKSNLLIWKICGISYRDEPEVESGQLLFNKERSWNALNLTLWYNEYSDLFYQHVYGDKETFHLAFRKIGQDYAQPETFPDELVDTLRHYDFAGRPLFQHRNEDKWSLSKTNKHIAGFFYENECREYLQTLRDAWDEWHLPNPLSLKPEPKYFQEAPQNPDCDLRFFHGELSLEEHQAKLMRLLQTFARLCENATVHPILLHDGLLGWNRSRALLPEQTTLNLALSFKELQMLAMAPPACDPAAFLWDVNPFYSNRNTLNTEPHQDFEPNKDDARFIDRQTGVFLRITALTDEGEMVSTKYSHRYRKEIIFPLRATEFLGAKLFIPANVLSVLLQDYGRDVFGMTAYGESSRSA